MQGEGMLAECAYFIYEDCWQVGIDQPGSPRCAAATLPACLNGSMLHESGIEDWLYRWQVVTGVEIITAGAKQFCRHPALHSGKDMKARIQAPENCGNQMIESRMFALEGQAPFDESFLP